MLNRFFILFVCICFLILPNSVKANWVQKDTLKLEYLENRIDTIRFNNSLHFIDSIEYELIQDTLNRIFGVEDTLLEKEFLDTLNFKKAKDTTLLLADSIDDNKNQVLLFNDILMPVKELSYDEFIEKMKDSLLFDKADSVLYMVYKLESFKDTGLLIFNDTTRQSVHKLISYFKARNIDDAKKYLLRNQDNLFLEKDSISGFSDSIQYIVKSLLSSFPEDSLNISFTNQINDTVSLVSAITGKDSLHLRIYDNRGEHAVLWIKKKGDKLFTIYLEDGVYVEKTKQQSIVRQGLDSEFPAPKLRKVEKVYKVIPLWELKGMADIKFNQGYVSDSWVEGGENSMSAISGFKFSADYNYGKLRNLDTDLEYKLGYLKTGDNPLRKNDDRFELNAKYGREAVKNWYYSFLLNFKTQFLKGKEYSKDTVIDVSGFLSPAHMVFSLGLDYKPGKKLTVLISPLTSKFTIVADTLNYDQTRFGLGDDEKVRKEVGAYVKAISKIKIGKNIYLQNKVNFFTNYSDNPQNIDIDWEVDLAMQLTDFIKITVNTHLIYDDDVDIPVYENGEVTRYTKNVQFKELFGIGFVYEF